MQRTSVVVGIILGVVVVVGLIGASAAYDKLSGPSMLDVTVERINSTHAAVAWTTAEPTHGYITTSVQYRCNASWLGINTVNDSSFTRTHLLVVPIYELNRSQMNETLATIPEDVAEQYQGMSPRRYEVTVVALRDGSGARKTIHSQTLGQACR